MRLETKNLGRFLEAAETALEFGQGELVLFNSKPTLLDRFSSGLHSTKSGKRFRPAIPALSLSIRPSEPARNVEVSDVS